MNQVCLTVLEEMETHNSSKNQHLQTLSAPRHELMIVLLWSHMSQVSVHGSHILTKVRDLIIQMKPEHRITWHAFNVDSLR